MQVLRNGILDTKPHYFVRIAVCPSADWTFPKDVTGDLNNHERVAPRRRGRREGGVLILHPVPIMMGWPVTAIALLSPD